MGHNKKYVIAVVAAVLLGAVGFGLMTMIGDARLLMTLLGPPLILALFVPVPLLWPVVFGGYAAVFLLPLRAFFRDPSKKGFLICQIVLAGIHLVGGFVLMNWVAGGLT